MNELFSPAGLASQVLWQICLTDTDDLSQGTADLPHGYWWSFSRVPRICLTDTDDFPYKYWISSWVLKIVYTERCYSWLMALIQVSVWKRGSGDKITKTCTNFVSQTLATGRYSLYTKGNLITKFCLYRTLMNRIREINVCCHGYISTMATKINTASISITVSMCLVLTW